MRIRFFIHKENSHDKKIPRELKKSHHHNPNAWLTYDYKAHCYILLTHRIFKYLIFFISIHPPPTRITKAIFSV